MIDLDVTCDALAELQVRRKFFTGTINKQVSAAQAWIRRRLGWKRDDDEKTREVINQRAARIWSAFRRGKPQRKVDEEIVQGLFVDLQAFVEGVEPLIRRRHLIELDMIKIARGLPVVEWASGPERRGFGEKALAVIIGECGNLSKYANPGKVWRRLGLAPFEGKALSTHRYEKSLSSEQWTEAGYSPKRRAEAYSTIDEPLLKGQLKEPLGPYRQRYLARRARTAETHPDWKPMRSHMDGLRIMTKQLILDLWSEWRRATSHMSSDGDLPAVNRSADEAGEPAKSQVMSEPDMPAPDLFDDELDEAA